MREMKQTIDISTKQEKAPAVRPCDLRRLWLRVRPPARWRALGGLLVALGIVRNEQESAPRARKGSLPASVPAITELELKSSVLAKSFGRR